MANAVFPNTPDMAYRGNDTTMRLLGTSIDGTNNQGKLWLPIWSGEVLHAYDQFRMFEPMVTSKTITSGRSMEFPITGTVTLKPAWAAGEFLQGGENAASTQFAVELDKRPMAAHFELDNVDLMVTQWEYRQELARQAGQTLANARDKQIAAYIALAGASAKLTADPRTGLSYSAPFRVSSAEVVTGSAIVTNTAEEALKVLEAIEEFCVDLQENDVPVAGCYCVVPPKLFQQIRRLGVAETAAQTNSMQPMFGGIAMAGGLGASFTQGMNSLSDSLVYMGVTIQKSNNLPNKDYKTLLANNIGETRYNVNGVMGAAGGTGASIRGLIFCSEAVASLRQTGLVVDTEDDIRRNTTFTVASMYSGTGIVKPELAKVLVGGIPNANVAATPTRTGVFTALGVSVADAGWATS